MDINTALLTNLCMGGLVVLGGLALVMVSSLRRSGFEWAILAGISAYLGTWIYVLRLLGLA